MPKEPVQLTRATRLINSGPVVLVTAWSGGQANVMVASWAMPVSSDPPLVAVAISPKRFTHALIKKSAEFVLNIPNALLAKQVKLCGSMSGDRVDKFKETGLTQLPASKVRPPLIKECVGHLECALVQAIDVGDHTVFVGQVVAAWVETGTFEGVWLVEREEAKLLHHLGGSSYCIPKGRFDV